MSSFAAYFERESARLWREWNPEESLERHESGEAFVEFVRAHHKRERGAKKKQCEQANLFGE